MQSNQSVSSDATREVISISELTKPTNVTQPQSAVPNTEPSQVAGNGAVPAKQ